jgi:two-component system CheB/CheR fusion protein
LRIPALADEQLETMNEEIRVHTAELDEARTFLEGVLSSVAAGVVRPRLSLRARTAGYPHLGGP